MKLVYRFSSHSKKNSHFLSLVNSLHTYQTSLVKHPIYNSIRDIPNLRIFMQNHVFAVWDYMTLLKRLQIDFTCVTIPWVPKPNAYNSHLINSIVQQKQSDHFGNEIAKSHFDLYLDIMNDINCNHEAIQYLIKQISNNVNYRQSLHQTAKTFPYIFNSTYQFTQKTLDRAMHGKTHEVASSFYFARVDPIPDMFRSLSQNLKAKQIDCTNLEKYLQRNIDINDCVSASVAQQLLVSLCNQDKQKWKEVEKSAIQSMHERISLWDGIYKNLLK